MVYLESMAKESRASDYQYNPIRGNFVFVAGKFLKAFDCNIATRIRTGMICFQHYYRLYFGIF